jgi:hypothetical protein
MTLLVTSRFVVDMLSKMLSCKHSIITPLAVAVSIIAVLSKQHLLTLYYCTTAAVLC